MMQYRLALGLFGFFALLTSVACVKEGGDSQYYTPFASFAVVDSNGNPIEGVFWSVSNGSGNAAFNRTSLGALSPLAFVDSEGGTCPDPDSETPQIANGNASQQGCTDALGIATVFCGSLASFVINIDDGADFNVSKVVFCPQLIGDSLEIVIDEFPTPTEVIIFQSAPVVGSTIGTRFSSAAICEAAAPDDFSEVHALISYVGSPIADMPDDFGVPAHVPIVTPDGTQIADDWDDLLDGSIDASLVSGGLSGGTNNSFWTGSAPDGAVSTDGNCVDWSAIAASATFGSAVQTDDTWLSNGNTDCADSLPILCVGF